MSEEFNCLYPCKKSFALESSLKRHYGRVPLCKYNWSVYEANLRQEFEDASQKRRADVRHERNGAAHDEQLGHHEHIGGGDDNAEVGDYVDWGGANVDMEDSVGREEDSHQANEAAGVSQQDPLPSQGRNLADPIVTVPPHQTPELDHDDSSAIITTDYEEYLPGPEGVSSASGDDPTPYLDVENAMDVDEADPGYVPEIDDTEQLEGVTETIQLSPESDEDEDPSEVETYPRAGEVKLSEEQNQSRFENLHLKRGGRPFHPFRSFAEFELAKWLNDLPLSKVDMFLQLNWVSH